MTKAGFIYQPEYPQSVSSNTSVVAFDPNWGPLDPNSAARYGYSDPTAIQFGPNGLPTNLPSGVVVQATESEAVRAYNDALLGVDNSGGCAGEAAQQLGMAGTTWTSAWNTVDNVRSQADSAALNDSQVTSAVQAWSACMAQQGYSYKTPQDAMSAPWGLTPDQNELNTAQADAQCKIQVNLMGTINQVTFDYEQKAVDANLPAVQHLQQLGLAAVQKAEAVLAQQPK